MFPVEYVSKWKISVVCAGKWEWTAFGERFSVRHTCKRPSALLSNTEDRALSLHLLVAVIVVLGLVVVIGRPLLTIINGNFDQQELNLLCTLNVVASLQRTLHTHYTLCRACTNVRMKYVALNGVILFIFIIILEAILRWLWFFLRSRTWDESFRFFSIALTGRIIVSSDVNHRIYLSISNEFIIYVRNSRPLIGNGTTVATTWDIQL